MNHTPPDAWIDAVQSAATGPELLSLLCRRLAQPDAEGPPLDDRRGEGAEEVFEVIARADAGFRLRLEEAIASYFKSEEASPISEAARPVIRGMLEIVPRLALTGAFTPLRAWLARHEAPLAADPTAVLGRAALAALAVSQPTGIADVRDFWMCWWREGPTAWQPRAFIGLRLQDPKAAAEELPLLMQRARSLGQDPGPLLQGMWLQPSAQPVLAAWLNDPGNPWAEEARQALRRRLPDVDLPKLSGPPRRRPLRSLAAPGPHRWAA
ncbi:hypothetical protein [Sorangium sp. So ce131]|uniref:hypothetical protein n=1 Tax=Sorangium sp. So ce131 TaxID=3133282 RepID=UPI003F63E599